MLLFSHGEFQSNVNSDATLKVAYVLSVEIHFQHFQVVKNEKDVLATWLLLANWLLT